MRTCMAVALAVLGTAGCDVNPPADIEGAEGVLDADDPYCYIYPADGYAVVELDYAGRFEVGLGGGSDAWHHVSAGYAAYDENSCQYGGGGSSARVQYGSELVGKPDCDHCSTRYRALFIEGLAFPGSPSSCANGFGCLSTTCMPVEPTSADYIAIWCDSPDEFAL